jgi:hypothetical protein
MLNSTNNRNSRTSIQINNQSTPRRADFERWRYEVACEASEFTMLKKAGRLRLMWGFEKLVGNHLQTKMQEQIEQSQTTESGFFRIREVTGLVDVLDIVDRLLNREVDEVKELIITILRGSLGRLVKMIKLWSSGLISTSMTS